MSIEAMIRARRCSAALKMVDVVSAPKLVSGLA
jgi:hypothetical protein